MIKTARRPVAMTLVLGLFSLVFAACTHSTTVQSDRTAELIAANEAYDYAILNQDRASLEIMFSEKYEYIAADGSVRGRQEKIENLTDPSARLLSAESYDIAVEVFNEAALVTGRFSGSFIRAGEEVTFDERFSTLWIDDKGAWRLRYEQVFELPAAD